jgi:hypothetical protein
MRCEADQVGLIGEASTILALIENGRNIRTNRIIVLLCQYMATSMSECSISDNIWNGRCKVSLFCNYHLTAYIAFILP